MSAITIIKLFSGIILAYLLGSIPTSVWIGKCFFGKDIRLYGSGNAGATNTMRILGWKAGVAVLVIDVLKGSLTVLLSDLFVPDIFSNAQIIDYNVACACSAVIGHIYPIFAGFKGGKGVATLAGIMFALLPWATSTACIMFTIILLISCYVSISSIFTAISFPLIVVFLPHVFTSLSQAEISEIIFSVAIAIFIPIIHLKNIRRLFAGEEKKLFTYKRSSS